VTGHSHSDGRVVVAPADRRGPSVAPQLFRSEFQARPCQKQLHCRATREYSLPLAWTATGIFSAGTEQAMHL
jgi:hypothetical protein